MTDSDNNRDKELDEILGVFRNKQPSTKHLQAWQAAVANKTRPRLDLFRVSQIAVAVGIGFIVGALSFYQKSEQTISVTENFEPSATIEVIYAKAE